MAESGDARRRSPFGRLAAHLNNPLYRNGYALILSVASTSGLGFVFWILAARIYSPVVVGVNSAAISAMMFLGGIAQLNLASALIRFTPAAGRRTFRFITSTYGIAMAVAVLFSTVFLLGLGRWAQPLAFLRSNSGFVAWFIAATVGWCIFVLQDSVLVGLRQATWVPVENTIFAVGKIILMIGFAVWLPMYGLYASWTTALAISVVFTNLIIFRGIMPRLRPELQQKESSLVVPQVARYVAADYIGALCWLAATTLLPLIVTSKAGATANAYFFLAWQTAFLMYHVSASMGSSLVVEASTNPSQLKVFTYRVVLQTLLLLIPGVIVLLVGAPYILHIFGRAYAEQATPLLRLLALSAVPYMVNILFVSVSRVHRRMKAIIATLVTMCGLILVLSTLLIDVYGITGVGLACLISQGLVALVILFTQVRPLIKRNQFQIPQIRELLSFIPGISETFKQPGPAGNPAGREPESAWVQPGFKELEIPVTSGLAVVQPGVAAVTALNRAARRVGPVLGIHRTMREPAGPQEQEQDSRLLAAILPEIHPTDRFPDPDRLSIRRPIPTVTDLAVFAIGPATGQPAAALKVARSGRAAAAIQKQAKNLAALRTDTRLGDWRHLLPQVLFSGRRLGQEAVVEMLLPGTALSQLLRNPILEPPAVKAAVTAIEELHLATARMVSLDGPYLHNWAAAPLARIRELDLPLSCRKQNARAFDRLGQQIQAGLVGKCTSISWIHGDYAPENILMAPDGRTVLGIVDWELARPDGLPGLDTVLLMVTSRMARQDREFGEVVRDLLYCDNWTPAEQAIFHRMRLVFPGDQISPRTLLLLCWLQHIYANVTKSDRYAGHWIWKTANIEPVLRVL